MDAQTAGSDFDIIVIETVPSLKRPERSRVKKGVEMASTRDVGVKNVTDNATVPSGLSEQEVLRSVEYFSLLRDWSLQLSNLLDRDDDTGCDTDGVLHHARRCGAGKPLRDRRR
jgi:hypothetical protein